MAADVLVTGAAGFLGRALTEQLTAAGRSVRALVRRADPDLVQLGVEIQLGDLRSADTVLAACRGVSTVYHTAAIAGIAGRWEDYLATNVQGTENVVVACQTHGVQKLIYTSSPSVTFAGEPQRNVNEEAPYPTQWLAHYPRSKALAEQAVLRAHRPGRLNTCALRPHLIWGPRDNHLIPRLIDRARSGKLRIVGDGKNLVDMIYVENAAEAHVLAEQALDAGRAGGKAFFLSQGSPVRCWDWINQILHLAQVPPVKRRVPFAVAYAAGGMLEACHRWAGWYTEPRMTRFLAAQLALDHYFDIQRARTELLYEPRISTEMGMQRLAAWLATTGTLPTHVR